MSDVGPTNQVRYLNENEVAAIIGLSLAWLRKARLENLGPPYRKFSRAVRYPEDELHRWIGQHRLRVGTSKFKPVARGGGVT